MQRRISFALGSLLAIAGAFVALYPFLSVWRVAGQALEELPQVPEVAASDTSHRIGALYDDGFVLATRTYADTTPQSVQNALLSSGFEAVDTNGVRWYAKECCGEYDALWVSVADTDGVVVATATAADADIQGTAAFLVLFGLILFISGAVIALACRANQSDAQNGPAHRTDPPQDSNDADRDEMPAHSR